MAHNAIFPGDRHAGAVPALSRLEISVVALAQHNSERTAGYRSGRYGRFIGVLQAIVGRRAVGPLANARLEALRLLAVVLHHRADRSAATILRSLATGLSLGDIEAVQAVVAAQRVH